MTLLFMDFETYYDKEYSLKKMTPPEYILDQRFEMIMCAVVTEDGESEVFEHEELENFLRRLDPGRSVVVTHNALFDACILAWRYNFIPAISLDTMGMSRALLGHKLRSHSLKSVAAHLKLPAKGDAIFKVQGMHAPDIKSAGLWSEFREYCRHDAQLCAGIFHELAPQMPSAELKVLDLVIRCATQPRLKINVPLLAEHLESIRLGKQLLLDACGLDKKDLMSQASFVKHLEMLGVDVETKPSPANPEESIPAVAKIDPFMATLQEHNDPRVQALVSARLGLKSTIEETRTEKLLAIAALPWAEPASIPIPIRYAGAHTHRFSGDWKINMQNLPRSSTGGSKLRKAIVAPEGHHVVVCDLGQIEARLVAWQAKCDKLVTQFRDRLDPYARLAESIFGYRVDRKKQVAEGFVGKSGILGLGYGLGSENFYIKTKAAARGQKVELGGLFTRELAERTVATYRSTFAEIPRLWRRLDKALANEWMGHRGCEGNFSKVGPVRISAGTVKLPNGLELRYDDPRWQQGQKVYRHPDGYYKKIYGAALLENITQALARILVTNALLRLEALGYRFVWQVHDELVFVVPESDVDTAKRIIYQEMTKAPSWAPDLPLSADVGSGKSYGDAK